MDLMSNFSNDAIVRFLAKKRGALAKSRSESSLADNLVKSSMAVSTQRIEKSRADILAKILPGRRTWVRVGRGKRKAANSAASTQDLNVRSIILTIARDRHSVPAPAYIIALDEFCRDVRESLSDRSYTFERPRVIPEVKDASKVPPEYRPLCTFSLKDSCLLSLLNRYLTELFDDQITSNAFAFRKRRLFEGVERSPTHSDAFHELRMFNEKSSSSDLYVAECDIKKFFDTLDHRVVKRAVSQANSKLSPSAKCDPRAIRLIHSYLSCFSFDRDVEVLDRDESYFKSYRKPPGVFPWVRKDIAKSRLLFPRNQVGIPQGGALSGLIANLVLSSADIALQAAKEQDDLYIRYCDDMIIVSPDRGRCSAMMDAYIRALVKLKLYPHAPVTVPYGKNYWKSKSRGPYLWSSGTVPWVAFVGYEINRDGAVRIRKKTIANQVKRIRDSLATIEAVIERADKEYSPSYVLSSVLERLVGMSVGKVKLWNYRSYSGGKCWVRGFPEVNYNRWSSRQARNLDRTRAQALARLRRYLGNLAAQRRKDPNRPDVESKSTRQVVFHGKPFSYYYGLFHRD